MYTRGLLRCVWRLDCYRGVEGSLEGLDRLNIRSCRWQFVPDLMVYGKNDILYTVKLVYGTKSYRDPRVLLSLDRMMNA